MQPKRSFADRARERVSRVLTRVLARYVSRAPDHEACLEHGLAALTAGRPADALEHFDAAIALKPDAARGHANRGAAAYRLGQLEQALESYERATSLEPAFAQAHRNKGVILAALGRFEQGLQSLESAFQRDPADFRALFEHAFTLIRMNRFADALPELDRVIEMNPAYPPPRLNKALCLLLAGDFDSGLPLFEWRWKQLGIDPSNKHGLPLWLGESPLSGKRILVPREQGLGDVLQFCRYVPELEKRGTHVVVSAPSSLLEVVRTVSRTATFVDDAQSPPQCDCVCPVLSLPLAFQTTLDSIPGKVPYLRIEEAKRESWSTRLGPANRLRVGLAWSGNPKHRDDARRSISIDRLQPLLGLPVDFHVVQKMRAADMERIVEFRNVHAHEIDDFADAGAIIEQMDLVISVDTAAAHLAGALAKPTWILLPFTPDWRWMLERADSPWYPTARLFRQPRYADWPSVIRDVVDELRCAAQRSA